MKTFYKNSICSSHFKIGLVITLSTLFTVLYWAHNSAQAKINNSHAPIKSGEYLFAANKIRLHAPMTPSLISAKDTLYPRTNLIVNVADIQPNFPGGDQAMNTFIKKNLKYPPDALRNGKEGLVVIQFIVDRNGKVLNPQVVKSLGFGTDEEATRVVNLFPDFKPALQDGVPIEFRYTLPIRYGITGRRSIRQNSNSTRDNFTPSSGNQQNQGNF